MPPKILKPEIVKATQPTGKTERIPSGALDKEAAKLKTTVVKGLFDVGAEALSFAKEWTKLGAEKERTKQAVLEKEQRIAEAEARLEEARQKYQAQSKRADTAEANANVMRRAAETLLAVLEDNRPGPDAEQRQLDRFMSLHDQLLRYCAQLNFKR